MIDLKPYYDAARAADDEMQRIMNEMNTAFGQGTDEGKALALELRPRLDDAKAKAKDANDLYISMRDSANVSDGAAREFVPVSDAAERVTGDAGKNIPRSEFLSMDTTSRMEFIKAGGKVTEAG